MYPVSKQAQAQVQAQANCSADLERKPNQPMNIFHSNPAKITATPKARSVDRLEEKHYRVAVEGSVTAGLHFGESVTAGELRREDLVGAKA